MRKYLLRWKEEGVWYEGTREGAWDWDWDWEGVLLGSWEEEEHWESWENWEEEEEERVRGVWEDFGDMVRTSFFFIVLLLLLLSKEWDSRVGEFSLFGV